MRSIRNIVRKYLTEAGIAGASTTRCATPLPLITCEGTRLDIVHQALGHESLATARFDVKLARKVMDQELQQNAL